MRIVRGGVAIVSLLASGAAYAGVPGWSLSETSGQVTVVSTGLVRAAVRGGGVATGDIVSTGRNGRAVLVRGEEYLVVAPNSRIRVADPAKTGGMTQIVEQFGNVIFKIKKMTMPHFAVETPFLAAVVKGTTFSVTVTDKGASVQVIEGRVEVATRDGGAAFMVLPGDIGSVNATAPGRLDMQGRESLSITSPTPDAATAAVKASMAESADQAIVAQAHDTQFSGAIDAAVGEGPVNLEAMSDGMVKGDSSMMAMVAMMSEASQDSKPSGASTQPVVANTAETTPVTTEAEVVAPLPPVAGTGPTAMAPPPEPEVVEALPPVAGTGPAPAALPPAPAAEPAAVVAAIGNSGSGNANSGNSGSNSNSGSNNSGSGNNGNSGNGNGGNGNGNGNRFAFGGNGNNGNHNGQNNGQNNNNGGHGRHD